MIQLEKVGQAGFEPASLSAEASRASAYSSSATGPCSGANPCYLRFAPLCFDSTSLARLTLRPCLSNQPADDTGSATFRKGRQVGQYVRRSLIHAYKKSNRSHFAPPFSEIKTPDLCTPIAQVGRWRSKTKRVGAKSYLCNRLLSTGPALWLLPFQQSLLSQSNPYELPPSAFAARLSRPRKLLKSGSTRKRDM